MTEDNLPLMPDLNAPPHQQRDDAPPLQNAAGDFLVPGFKSVDAGHETTEPLHKSNNQPDSQQAANHSAEEFKIQNSKFKIS